jgi:hypothetical protein
VSVKAAAIAQTLRNSQDCERRDVRRVRKHRGRDGEQDEADQDPFPAIDLAAEIADCQAGKCHAERAGVHGKAHGGGRDAVMARERGKDGLGREQIDDGEEGRQTDDDGTEEQALGMRLRLGLCAGTAEAASFMARLLETKKGM